MTAVKKTTSVKLDSISENILTAIMKKENLTQSQALRFVIRRYRDINELLSLAGVRVKDYPAKIELEFPK